ncbi:MAG TPA: ABC transporter permease [Roseiflexaceae bacterium]|nr:ABC transporter permease [Roseiflexaceae bacterium]
MSEANRAIDSTTTPVITDVRKIGDISQRPPRTLWGDARRRFLKHRLAVLGSLVIIFFTLAVLVGPSIYTVDREALNFDVPTMAGPTWEAPMGTDDLGRDILARALFGGRVTLAVGVTAMLIAILVGTIVGSISGFFGGYLDQLLMWITDTFLSMPTLPLFLLIVYLFRDTLTRALGPETGIFLLVVSVIGLLTWMPTARVVRASFQTLKHREFVEAATCLGVGPLAIMFRHILPNVMSPIIVAATLGVGTAIITESTLSFLGVGFPPDLPTWGRLVTDGQNFLELAPHMSLLPSLLIFLTVLSINFIGDGLRDALDPRSRL